MAGDRPFVGVVVAKPGDRLLRPETERLKRLGFIEVEPRCAARAASLAGVHAVALTRLALGEIDPALMRQWYELASRSVAWTSPSTTCSRCYSPAAWPVTPSFGVSKIHRGRSSQSSIPDVAAAVARSLTARRLHLWPDRGQGRGGCRDELGLPPGLTCNRWFGQTWAAAITDSRRTASKKYLC